MVKGVVWLVFFILEENSQVVQANNYIGDGAKDSSSKVGVVYIITLSAREDDSQLVVKDVFNGRVIVDHTKKLILVLIGVSTLIDSRFTINLIVSKAIMISNNHHDEVVFVKSFIDHVDLIKLYADRADNKQQKDLHFGNLVSIIDFLNVVNKLKEHLDLLN